MATAHSIEIANAAKDLHALEALVVDAMRRAENASSAESTIETAAPAAWRLARDGPPDVRQGTLAVIRRAVQWLASRGDLESAYALSHMTNDVASLEDVYRAASRGRGDGDARVMAAVRDRLAEAQNAISSSS